MKCNTIKALLIEDNPADVRLIREMLAESESTEFELESFSRLAKGIEYLNGHSVDVVLLDLTLPDSTGMATFEKLFQQAPHLPIIVLSGVNDEQMAIDSMRIGLQDYLVKNKVDGELLSRSLCYAIERKRLEEALRLAHDQLELRVKQRTLELSSANKALQDEIAERRRVEEQLKESKAQAELYVDLMAHDINNMNQIMMGFLELAVENTDLSEETKMMIEKPIETIKSSTRLIDNVRKLQAIKFDKMAKSAIDLGLSISEAVNDYRDLPGNSIHINYQPVSGYRVLANDLLIDVFTNLIGNSIKHSRGGVTIDIALSRIASGNGKDHYLVAIEDNGPGVPDDMKEKIFKRLHRGDTRVRGSGLGLYIVKALIDDFSGNVWVEDRVSGDQGKGSKFLVMLPAI